MYADTITQSMQKTIDETNRRRKKQNEYNLANNIEPKQIEMRLRNILGRERAEYYEAEREPSLINDPVILSMGPRDLEKAIEKAHKDMEEAAAALDFLRAAKFRDEMNALKKIANRND